MKMLGTATRCADDTTQLSLLVSMIFLVALVGAGESKHGEFSSQASFARHAKLFCVTGRSIA